MKRDIHVSYTHLNQDQEKVLPQLRADLKFSCKEAGGYEALSKLRTPVFVSFLKFKKEHGKRSALNFASFCFCADEKLKSLLKPL